jgi:hypothetical protein
MLVPRKPPSKKSRKKLIADLSAQLALPENKGELNAGRAAYAALCSIHGHDIPWEDLDLASRVNCHMIAQAAIATVLNSGYSFSEKNLGGDDDEIVE